MKLNFEVVAGWSTGFEVDEKDVVAVGLLERCFVDENSVFVDSDFVDSDLDSDFAAGQVYSVLKFERCYVLPCLQHKDYIN